LLCDPRAGGWAVTPASCTRRVCSCMKNSTYSRCRNTVSTVRKSQARMPAACWRRNDRQVGDAAARRGAGWRPLARRTWRWSLRRPGSQAAAAPRGCAGSPTAGSRWPAARSGSAPAGEPVAGRAATSAGSSAGAPCGGAIAAASGRDHEDRPSAPGQEAAERCEQRAVLGPEPRPWVLAAQDCQLVAED
jgi:hypothetical protein